MLVRFKCFLIFQMLVVVPAAFSNDIKDIAVYTRIKAGIDAVSSINTHDHLMPFEVKRKLS